MHNRTYRRKATLSVRCVTALALAACGPEVIGDPAAGTIVYGRVTNLSGASIANATVRFGFASGSSCATVLAGSDFSTDTSGYYLRALFQFGAPFTGCVKVVVLPPLGAPLVPDSTIRQAVGPRPRTAIIRPEEKKGLDWGFTLPIELPTCIKVL